MKKNDKKESNLELLNVLNRINVVLYVIAALLSINVVLSSLNVANTRPLKDAFGPVDSGAEDELTYDYDVSEFSEVDYKGLKELMKDKGTHVVYIGRESCGYCAMFIPVMQQAQNEYGFKTYYFDITKVFDYDNNKVVDETAYEELSKYNDFFSENFLATPMVVIFKDGKYVNGTMGYQEIEAYSSFLEENGISKK